MIAIYTLLAILCALTYKQQQKEAIKQEGHK